MIRSACRNTRGRLNSTEVRRRSRSSSAPILSSANQDAAWKVQQQAEEERLAYDAYRRDQAIKLLGTLTAEQQAGIDEEARSYASSFTGSLRDRMAAVRRVHLAAATYGDRLPTFEQWKAERLSA
jgi:hypothetical protein